MLPFNRLISRFSLPAALLFFNKRSGGADLYALRLPLTVTDTTRENLIALFERNHRLLSAAVMVPPVSSSPK